MLKMTFAQLAKCNTRHIEYLRANHFPMFLAIKMDSPIQRYHAPPKGYHTTITSSDFSAPPTRQDKSQGPYGVFIHYEEDPVIHPCPDDNLD